MTERQRVLAIVNPTTGTLPIWRLRRVLHRVAAQYSIDLEIVETEYADHATQLVQTCDKAIDAVIAVGGDGTLSEVVAGAVGRDIMVGIIPTGSTNMVAKDLGIPRLLATAARVALTSSTIVRLDIAKADDTPFMHMGGAGYDAAIMRDSSPRLKRVLRWVAYFGPGIQQLRSAPFNVQITVDQTTLNFQARMVLFALGGSIIHPRFVVGTGIDRTDGILDVVVFTPPTFTSVLGTFGWMLLRRPAKSRWQHQLRGRKVKLLADRKVPYELDGSYRGNLPVNIEMLDDGVTVRVPSVPTPGEIQAHLKFRDDLTGTEAMISGRHTPV